MWRIIPNDATFYPGSSSAYITRQRADRDQRTSTPGRNHSQRGDKAFYLLPAEEVPHARHAAGSPQRHILPRCSAKISSRPKTTSGPSSRKPIADRLAVLKRAGCDVKVIVNNDSTLMDAGVLTVLLRAGIPVYNAHRIGHIHTHGKDLYISAKVGSGIQNLVVSGSLNLTRSSLKAHDEAGYKVNDAAVFERHNALWNIWAANSTRIRPASAAGDQTITVPKTNDPTLIED